MPEHCIKQYEKMMRSRIPHSKPLQVIKDEKKHSLRYHAVDPAILPSSNEINNMIPSNDLAPANNYKTLRSSNRYNGPAVPNRYKDLSSTNKYRDIPSSNKYNDWSSYRNQHNNLDASVQHIEFDEILHNEHRVDHKDFEHHGGHRKYDDYSEDNLRSSDREDHRRDFSHYIDLGRYRGHVYPRQKALRKKHKKLVYESEPVYSQESLELVYNSLHNIMNVAPYNMDDDDESSEHTKRRNYNLRRDSTLHRGHIRTQGHNRNRQHARHLEHAIIRDQNDDSGLIYGYDHDTRRSGADDESDSNEYQYVVKNNYNDNDNDLVQESDIENYVFKTQGYGKYLTIDPPTSEHRRRARQNFAQDVDFTDYNVSPFSLKSVLDIESLTSDEPIHIPVRGYQSPVQTMLHAIESDVRNQPIAPQIGVLPFLGVSAIYHQPISKNSVHLIKDVAYSYQEAAKEQYKEIAKYFPPPPQPLVPEFSENSTTLGPVEFYLGQRKDDELGDKIRHKIEHHVKHFRRAGKKT